MRVKTVIYQMETDAFSKVSTIFSRKILAWSISNSYNLIEKEKMFCLVVEYQMFCDRFEIDIGLYNLETKRIHPISVKQRDKFLYIHTNHYCVIWTKKTEKMVYLKG